MKTGLLIGFITLSLSLSAFGKEPTGLKSDKQKFSYAVGFQISQNLKRQNLDLDSKAFAQGAQDAISNAKPRLKTEEMQAAIQSQQKKEMEKQNRQSQIPFDLLRVLLSQSHILFELLKSPFLIA